MDMTEELERLRRFYAQAAWHRDGKGPGVPVLQERYDKLRANYTALRAAVVTPDDLEDVGEIVHSGAWSCPCGADPDENLNFLDAAGMKKVTHLKCQACGRLVPFRGAVDLEAKCAKLRSALEHAVSTIEHLTASIGKDGSTRPGVAPKALYDVLAGPCTDCGAPAERNCAARRCAEHCAEKCDTHCERSLGEEDTW